MKNIISKEEINKFKEDGAIFLKGKFDILCNIVRRNYNVGS